MKIKQVTENEGCRHQNRTDYTHIVERLRKKASMDRLIERHDRAELLEQAANAIEELRETTKTLCRMVDRNIEVVRCTECKYYMGSSASIAGIGIAKCKETDLYMPFYGYCSYGERIEE